MSGRRPAGRRLRRLTWRLVSAATPADRARSGDGFVVGADGVHHWGRHGAAGLLLRHRGGGAQGRTSYLLAQRGFRSHQGGTWALPGGALDADETPVEGALREVAEELGAPPALQVRAVWAVDAGGWRYSHVLADLAARERWQPEELTWETEQVRWVAEADVLDLDLHPGLRSAWPALLDAWPD